MKILLLSFYYPPDLSAGSFRASSLVGALLKKGIKDIDIDVITTLPNRYKSFVTESKNYKELNNVKVFRLEIPVHKGGVLDQSKAYVSYARQVLALVDKREYNIVFATSGRLMTAVLGAWVASKKGVPLYLDIRDIFVDTIKDVFSRQLSILATPFFSFLEKWAVNKAAKVNLVSEGFREYFETRYPGKKFSFFTNGIDAEFIVPDGDKLSAEVKNSVLKVLYAGNIGEGQGLHKILPLLSEKLGKDVEFIVVGDGGRRHELEQALSAKNYNNVKLVPPVNRNELLRMYQDADVLFLHLNDYQAFYKVLPSKLFEYAALGKPIFAGVSGYAAKFISTEIDNAQVFHPCDIDGAVAAFQKLNFTYTPRTKFVEKYARDKIMDEMSDDVLSVVE